MVKIKYEFKNRELLDLALTQSGANAVQNNERLEFIGDRVLGLTVAYLLYDMFRDESEGELARRHAKLVSTRTLAVVARQMELESGLRHGHLTGGRKNHVLANTTEAVLGAIFLDGGYDVARDVIMEYWRDLAEADPVAPKDPKTALQEFVQRAADGALPVYEYELIEGNGMHNPEFSATVTAVGLTATGHGASKKAASIDAAAALLKKLAI